MRATIALALIAAVLATLTVAPALRRFAHQSVGHDVAPAGDHESLYHAEGINR